MPCDRLLDLPIKPEGRIIQQLADSRLAYWFAETRPGSLPVGMLRMRSWTSPLVGQRCHFADRPFCGLSARAIGVKVKDNALGFGVAQQLAYLSETQRRPHRRDYIRDACTVERNHVEIAFHHDGLVLLGDRRSCFVQREQNVAFIEQLGFR